MIVDKGLRNQIDKFYKEANEEESWDLGEMAVNLVPKLDYLIEKLENENQSLYGKLNMISDIVEKGRKDLV